MNKHIRRIALIWTFSHLIVFSFSLLCPLWGSVTFEESVELCLLIAPLFAGFTTSVVTYAMTPSTQKGSSPRLDVAGISISYAFPAAFILLTCVFISIYTFDLAPLKFSTLKQIVGIIETTVAFYIGIIFSRLFSVKGDR